VRRRQRQRGHLLGGTAQAVVIVAYVDVAGRCDDHEKSHDQDRDQMLEKRLGADQPLIGGLCKKLGVPRHSRTGRGFCAGLAGIVRPFGRRYVLRIRHKFCKSPLGSGLPHLRI
jgi:hypothetical protein